MKPTIKIVVLTHEGEGIITSNQPWNTIGEYEVTGEAAEQVREWIENEYGAFGHTIGTHAAPCDLHRAAVMQQQMFQPEDDFVVESIEGDVQEYDSKTPAGCVN